METIHAFLKVSALPNGKNLCNMMVTQSYDLQLAEATYGGEEDVLAFFWGIENLGVAAGQVGHFAE